jgi:hypothetical protein
MRVRNFFLLCMSVMGLLAATAALKLVADAAAQYGTATRAAAAIEIVSELLTIPEKLTAERLPITSALTSSAMMTEKDATTMQTARRAADVAIARSTERIAASDYPGAAAQAQVLTKLAQALEGLRAKADSMVAKPGAERDAAFTTSYREATEALFGDVDRIADGIDLAVSSIDSDLAGFVELARRSWGIRDEGARRATVYIGSMTARKQLTAAQLERVVASDARIAKDWLAIDAAAHRLGDVAEITTAIAAAKAK